MQTLIGLLAGGVLAVTVFPQATRAWRIGTHGVSPTTYQLIVAVGFAWVVYGATQGLWEVMIADATFGLSAVVVLAACRRHGARVRDLVPVALGSVALAAALGLTMGAAAIGWFAVTVAGVIRIPQIVDALRSNDVSGVSVSTWWLGVFGNVLWAAYGVLARDPRLYLGALVAGVMSLAIIVIVEYRRRGARPTDLAVDRLAA